MSRIKLGMIGGGPGAFIGDAHRRAARISNEYNIVGGVFSHDPTKTKQLGEEEGFDANRCYACLDDFIAGELKLPAGERIEAVSIVTPNVLHHEAASKLIQNGFHIICEKPMTTTVEEAEDLERLVEKHNVAFCLTHTYTGYPMVRQMKELIEQGVLGTIQRVDAQYYQGWVNSLIHGTDSRITGVWRLDPKQAGASSCMGDIGVHAFNLIEYTTGLEIQSVLSDLNTVSEGVELDLDGTVLVRLKNNLKGVIRSSQVAAGEENNLNIAVYGSKASLKWEQENPNFLYLLSDTEPTKVYKPAHEYNGKFAEASHVMPSGHPEGIYEAFANLYKGAAKAIKGEELNKGEFPGVKDGVRGMKFINAVVESDKSGNTWVEL